NHLRAAIPEGAAAARHHAVALCQRPARPQPPRPRTTTRATAHAVWRGLGAAEGQWHRLDGEAVNTSAFFFGPGLIAGAFSCPQLRTVREIVCLIRNDRFGHFGGLTGCLPTSKCNTMWAKPVRFYLRAFQR